MNSKIVGAFLNDKLVAGYMLVTSPKFRSLMFVSDEIRKNDAFFKNDEYEMMEVNGLGIGPSLKKPSLQIRVCMNLIKDIFFARKKFVLLMRNSRNLNMERFLNMANPTNIYEGQPSILGSQKTHDSIQVSYTSRWSIVLNIHKYLLELRSRQSRAAKFVSRQNYTRSSDRDSAELA